MVRRWRGLGIDAQDVLLGVVDAAERGEQTPAYDGSREYSAARDRLASKGLVRVVNGRVVPTELGTQWAAEFARRGVLS